MASPLPALKGTLVSYPAAFAASSTAELPAIIIVSAKLIPNSEAIGSKIDKVADKRVGSLPSQSFCGANLILAPFAPPLKSDPLKVLALSQAIHIRSEIESPDLEILFFTSSTL